VSGAVADTESPGATGVIVQPHFGKAGVNPNKFGSPELVRVAG
jgi:hypothetical protein